MNELPPVAWLGSFEAVAHTGSFRAAARQLGVSPSAVSHSVRALEDLLDVRLFHRSTRSVRISAEGEALLAVASPALEALRGAMESLSAASGAVKGTLRISVSRAAARPVLMPYVAEMLRRHPKAEIELVVDDAVADLIADGFDAGVRFVSQAGADMVARPIGPRQRFVVVASEQYLKGRPVPHRPEQLREHRCIRIVFPSGQVYRWEFAHAEEHIEVDVLGPLSVSDVDTALGAALAGIGVAYVDLGRAAPYIERKQLQTLLDEWRPEEPGYMLVFPSRRLIRPVLRAFLDLLAEFSPATKE